MSDMIWLVNTKDTTIEICITELKRWYKFQPYKPLQLPLDIWMRYKDRNNAIRICDNPEIYFKDKNLNQLIIRDAGIGDLLLLEPVLRQLKKNGNRDITILTRYPEVYDNNSYIDNVILSENKDDVSHVKFDQFDTIEDLRSYSETAPTRDKKHRTDIYNEKFNIEIEDKEPKIYFNDIELNTKYFKKKKGYKYIGLQLDASHTARRYARGKELAEYIVSQDEKNIVVIFGSYDYVKDIKGNSRIIDLQGKTQLRECINIMRYMDCLVAVDSGLMHVALSLHVPTVCLFGIITPDFRIRYYKGAKEIIYHDLPCKGCGDFHMVECKTVETKKGSIPPCMNIEPIEIYEKMNALKGGITQVLTTEKPEYKVNIIKTDKKITMPIIVLNEEKNLPRFIELVMSNTMIGKVIAIDGGSTDNTVKLLKDAGAFVYTHTYDKSYHDMQALQRNISCSFVEDGTPILIMDIDECFSKELSDYLPVLAESSIAYGMISRRTYKYYADIEDNTKRIKDYPDYQPRFYIWDKKYKFVKSPHHITLNTPQPTYIQKDIIHFECEGKDRGALEKDWAIMWDKTKEVYK
jgi:ADP-heptose:LPS heptosyltransferase